VAEPRRGMGRGLAAILTATAPAGQEPGATGDAVSDLRQVPVGMIRPNPHQPRRHFDEAALAALADSLRERGVLQPVLVRPVPGGTYELVAGERRWRAAQLAGFETVPAVVRAHDDAESLELALIENVAREDLNPVEEARACVLLTEELGLTREDLGRRIGRSRVAVSNLIRLLDLPDEVLGLIASGTLSEGHGRAVLMAGDHEVRRRLARRAAAQGWSVRRTEAEARAASEAAQPIRARRGPAAHPDQVAAAAELAETLGRALGSDVRVTPHGEGYTVTLSLASHEAAEELARRFGS
jgi:ParB family transcriptional regulator, chromosome partitioning protein